MAGTSGDRRTLRRHGYSPSCATVSSEHHFFALRIARGARGAGRNMRSCTGGRFERSTHLYGSLPCEAGDPNCKGACLPGLLHERRRIVSKHRSCTFPAGDVLSEWEVLPGCTPIADFTPMDGSLSEHRIRISLSYGRIRRTVMSRWEGGRRHCPRAKSSILGRRGAVGTHQPPDRSLTLRDAYASSGP